MEVQQNVRRTAYLCAKIAQLDFEKLTEVVDSVTEKLWMLQTERGQAGRHIDPVHAPTGVETAIAVT